MQEAITVTSPVAQQGTSNYTLIDPRYIHPNPENLREDFGNVEGLAKQIEDEGGLINAIVVKTVGTGDERRLVNVDGDRRLRAVHLLIQNNGGEVPECIRRIPVRFKRGKVEGDENVIFQFRANSGKSFTYLEQAEGVRRLAESGHKRKEIAEMTGLKYALVGILLNLAALPESLKTFVKNEMVKPHALLKIWKEQGEDEEMALAFINEAIEANEGNPITGNGAKDGRGRPPKSQQEDEEETEVNAEEETEAETEAAPETTEEAQAVTETPATASSPVETQPAVETFEQNIRACANMIQEYIEYVEKKHGDDTVITGTVRAVLRTILSVDMPLDERKVQFQSLIRQAHKGVDAQIDEAVHAAMLNAE